MDLNSGSFNNNINNNKNINLFSEKQYLIVKLPANVQNHQKAIEQLGGKDKIFSKVKNYFYLFILLLFIVFQRRRPRIRLFF